MSTTWTMNYNDTKERVIELVTNQLPPEGDPATFEAARAEVLEKLAKLPGPNAHVDAHGTESSRATVFVGTGDPFARYPSSKSKEEVIENLKDPRIAESLVASEQAKRAKKPTGRHRAHR